MELEDDVVEEPKKTPEEIERLNFINSDTAKLIRHYKKMGYTRAEIQLKVGAEMNRRKRNGQ